MVHNANLRLISNVNVSKIFLRLFRTLLQPYILFHLILILFNQLIAIIILLKLLSFTFLISIMQLTQSLPLSSFSRAQRCFLYQLLLNRLTPSCCIMDSFHNYSESQLSTGHFQSLQVQLPLPSYLHLVAFSWVSFISRFVSSIASICIFLPHQQQYADDVQFFLFVFYIFIEQFVQSPRCVSSLHSFLHNGVVLNTTRVKQFALVPT